MTAAAPMTQGAGTVQGAGALMGACEWQVQRSPWEACGARAPRRHLTVTGVAPTAARMAAQASPTLSGCSIRLAPKQPAPATLRWEQARGSSESWSAVLNPRGQPAGAGTVRQRLQAADGMHGRGYDWTYGTSASPEKTEHNRVNTRPAQDSM